MKTKCDYCGNDATRKDYREIDGITGKVLSCDTCVSLTNKGVKDMRHEYEKLKEEFLNFDMVDGIFESAMNQFWDTVIADVVKSANDIKVNFIENGHRIFPDELEAWKEEMYNIIRINLDK